MTEYFLIIAVVAFVVVAVVAYKIIHGLLKTLLILIALISIVLGVGAFFVVMDANDLKEKFGSEKNLFLLVHEQEVISALEFDKDEKRMQNQQQIESHTDKLKREDYAGIRKGYYKVIVINSAIVEESKIKSKNISSEKLNSEYAEEKAEFFSVVANELFSDPVFLISQYKKGNIEIHEETIMFKIIKVLPTSMIKTIADKAIDKTKSIVVDKIE
ncbi:hypothetical protein CMO88_04350 [Candidatus Woesearchaeota archaeon]|nr:hypothetical protein [Candidatus Woesearchaeota archaeon]|tara:strand:- start:15468 stop:16112 length:645 start_codon:yes stop_codon:yes gene_type:complete